MACPPRLFGASLCIGALSRLGLLAGPVMLEGDRYDNCGGGGFQGGRKVVERSGVGPRASPPPRYRQPRKHSIAVSVFLTALLVVKRFVSRLQ